MSTFIKYTIGLECNGYKTIGKMIKVAYYRNTNGTVSLKPESGRTLAPAGGVKTISAAQFEARPTDPYDNVKEARWALAQVGWTPMSDDVISEE